MSVYQTPELSTDERGVLELIDKQRDELRDRVAEPRRWNGSLRRMSFAKAVQGSNSIEGYDASLDDVVAAVDGEPTVGADAETEKALVGYRDAMTYVLQIAGDETMSIDEGLLKGLQFMMLKHDLNKNPGRWRPGAIHVRRESTGDIVYEGPDAEQVPSLIQEMLVQLREDDCHVIVKAAMAHLNLVMIHPFSDGNGRMARCLQTIVLARDKIVVPVFSSIEEFLGRNTQTYYEVLGDVGQGSWNPENDARPWVRFCLRAHFLQARTLLQRREEIEAVWRACFDLIEKHGLAERCTAALMDAAYGFRVRRSSYQRAANLSWGEEVPDVTASRDLKAMVQKGLLLPVGERRSRHYLASDELKAIREEIRGRRAPREERDPFKIVRNEEQLALPTGS
ncbi:MAG TPA: Fic family protein [Solirubrobacterales bacterium]|nr:Fic family protein [Solirubrobacterales bacterium]